MGAASLCALGIGSPTTDLTADLEVVPNLDPVLIEYCPSVNPVHPGISPGTWWEIIQEPGQSCIYLCPGNWPAVCRPECDQELAPWPSFSPFWLQSQGQSCISQDLLSNQTGALTGTRQETHKTHTSTTLLTDPLSVDHLQIQKWYYDPASVLPNCDPWGSPIRGGPGRRSVLT